MKNRGWTVALGAVALLVGCSSNGSVPSDGGNRDGTGGRIGSGGRGAGGAGTGGATAAGTGGTVPGTGGAAAGTGGRGGAGTGGGAGGRGAGGNAGAGGGGAGAGGRGTGGGAGSGGGAGGRGTGGGAGSGSGGAGTGGRGTGGAGGSGAGGRGAGGAAPGTGGGGGATAFVYPLKASANGRTLVDQNGRPFLLAGDSAQAYMVNLPEADADSYLTNRVSLGFNAIWSNLLVATYTGGRADGTTSDGIAPFTTPNNLGTPNEAYFAHADRMLQAAARHGVVVVLDLIETGSWLTVLRSNGVTAARAYGRFLGSRYVNVDNIIWMSGNDFQTWENTDDDALVRAVAQGIRDMDTRHLQTVELDYPVSDSLDAPNWRGFVGLNCAYTYYSIYALLYGDYNRASPIPSIMIESNYEGQALELATHNTTAHDVRAQYYWSDLSGASGQFYGDQPVNHFDSDWRSHLGDPGALQNQHLQNLLVPRRWYDLVPDQNHTVVTAGYGTFVAATTARNNQDGDYAPTARTADGTLVITYMPSARTITVDMTQLAGAATARWYDPTNGAFTAIAGSPFANTGTRTFTPPATPHSDNATDWVLLLEAP